MEFTAWTLTTTITALSAVIAAVSSLRNGRILKKQESERRQAVALWEELKRRQKKTPNDGSKDWYTAPDLD